MSGRPTTTGPSRTAPPPPGTVAPSRPPPSTPPSSVPPPPSSKPPAAPTSVAPAKPTHPTSTPAKTPTSPGAATSPVLPKTSVFSATPNGTAGKSAFSSTAPSSVPSTPIKGTSAPTGASKPGAVPAPPSEAPPDTEESSEEDDSEDEEEPGDDTPGPPEEEVTAPATEMVTKLQSPGTLTVKDMLQLKSYLSAPGRTYKNDFVQNDGLETFSALLGEKSKLPKSAQSDDIRIEVLNCLEAFLGSAEPAAWLTPILYSKGLLPNICLEVGSKTLKLKVKAVQLLTVICWINADGRKSVFTALDVPKPFHALQTVINDLKGLDAKSADQITNTMILINSLINSAPRLEERLDARKRLKQLGLFPIIEKLSDAVEASPNETAYNELQAQLDEYDSTLLRDQRETLRDGIDLTDPDAVYGYLKKSVSEDGFGAQFLSILQALMTVPSDKDQGEKIWNNVSHVVGLGVAKNGDGRIGFEALKAALKKKEEDSDKESESRVTQLEAKLEQQRAELHQMTMKARYADELKKKLVDAQAKLAQGVRAGDKKGPTHQAPPAPKGAPPAAPGSDAAKLAAALERIAQLEAQLASGGGGLPDAPPVDGAPPEAPPMDDGAPPPPPMDGGDGPPEAPPMDGDGPPDAPPMDGDGPPAPPPMGGKGGGGGGVPGLPKKRVIKPTQKLRKFHWQKVEDRAVKDSLWFTLNDDEIKFDTTDFENTFQQKDAPPKGESKEKEEKKKKAEVVKLVDEKRSYNTDITLARFRMTNSHIRDAILSIDETALDQDKLMQLIKVAPTPEEIELIAQYTGDVAALGNTEKFFRCISTIPRIQRRLEFMLFKQQFKAIYTGFKANVDSVSNALEQVKNSKHLKKILTISLAFGNYMNGGTPKGQAWGFKLSALNRLNGSKSADNQSSLLHYIIEYINRTSPQTRSFMDELKDVGEACRVESLFLQGEVGKVVGIVQRIDVELQRSEENIIDRFVPVMREFHAKANKKISKISTRLDKTFEDYNALLKWFAIGAEEKMQWEDFFLIFDRFIKAYQVAEGQLEEIKQKKLKQAKMDAYKEKVEKEKAEAKASKASGGGGGEMKKKKKKPKKEHALVDRVMTSLRKRRDSEFIRMQMLGQVDKPKKMKKRRKKPTAEGGEPGPRRQRGQSVKGIFGRKQTTTDGAAPKKKKAATQKGTGKSDADLVATIQGKLGS